MKDQPLEVSEIKLHPGEVHRVALGGLAGGGYTWTNEIQGKAGVVSVATETPPSAEPKPAPGGLPPPSSTRERVFVITALKPGTARVKFSLRRSWEKDKPPPREITVDVSVQN